MPLNKKQIKRLVKFSSLLKQNKYPNATKFEKILRNADLYGNENIACSLKTIYRDIETLKKQYKAPIEFDPQYNGYYLKHHGWSLDFPVLQDETILASVLGAKLAQDLMPEPLKTKINDAVDQQLTSNNPDFLDSAFIDSLIAASGVKVQIEAKIFQIIFSAWQEHEAVDIEYSSKDGNISTRRIEPHVLTYYNAAWYIKGFCLRQNAIRVFALHRIIQAELTNKFFDPDPLIIQAAKNRQIFGYKTIKNIQINCSATIASYVKEQHQYYNEEIKEHDDGSVTVYIAEAPEHEIIKWILAEGGNAKVIKPKNLAQKIVIAAQKVAEVNA
jgi:predicted DNA-binding transcriptional regulator YafY